MEWAQGLKALNVRVGAERREVERFWMVSSAPGKPAGKKARRGNPGGASEKLQGADISSA